MRTAVAGSAAVAAAAPLGQDANLVANGLDVKVAEASEALESYAGTALSVPSATSTEKEVVTADESLATPWVNMADTDRLYQGFVSGADPRRMPSYGSLGEVADASDLRNSSVPVTTRKQPIPVVLESLLCADRSIDVMATQAEVSREVRLRTPMRMGQHQIDAELVDVLEEVLLKAPLLDGVMSS